MNWRKKFKKTLAEEALLPSPYMLKYVIKRGQISGRSGAYEVIFDLTDASAKVREEILTNFPEAAKSRDYCQVGPDLDKLPPVVSDQEQHQNLATGTREYLRLQLSGEEATKFATWWADYNLGHAHRILHKNSANFSTRSK